MFGYLYLVYLCCPQFVHRKLKTLVCGNIGVLFNSRRWFFLFVCFLDVYRETTFPTQTKGKCWQSNFMQMSACCLCACMYEGR